MLSTRFSTQPTKNARLMIYIFILFNFTSVLTCATSLFAEQRTEDQIIKEGQRWEGECFQEKYPRYPLNIDITKVTGNVFSGTYDASYDNQKQAVSKARIKGGIERDQIFFTSYESIRGRDLIPSYFYGKILDKTMIVDVIGGRNAEVKALCRFHLKSAEQ
jgi:hypothetical protein